MNRYKHGRSDAWTLEHYAPEKWKDLTVSATIINPVGGASDPDRDPSDGRLLFDSSSTELILLDYQIQHGTGKTYFKPHVHWQKTTSASGNVAWRARYKHNPVGGVEDAAWTDLGIVSSSIIPDLNTAKQNLITPLGNIDLSAYGDSHGVFIELSRVGGDASDTYGADVKLIFADCHYLDSNGGSDTEYGSA